MIYGYTGPYIHGNNQGKRKREDIVQKVFTLKSLLVRVISRICRLGEKSRVGEGGPGA